MKRSFNPIADRGGEIIDYIMSQSIMPNDDTLLFQIRLAVEEVVENIVNYAYENGNGSLEVEVECEKDGAVLSIALRDKGRPFNPLEKEDPDLTLNAEDRPIGGLGIFLCKQLMDNVMYQYENGCNVLTLRKNVH